MFAPIVKYGCIPFELLLGHRYAEIRLLHTTPPRHSRDDGPASAPASHNVAFVAEAVRDQSQQYYPERYVTNPSNITPSPAMSESFNGMNGRENTMFPTGTMTVDCKSQEG